MELTPDACMDNHWADQKSLWASATAMMPTRPRSTASQQPAPAHLLCGSYLEVVKASPATTHKPKDLNQLFLKEKGSQVAAGDAKKTKKADQAPGLQLNELSVQTGGEQQRVDSASSTR